MKKIFAIIATLVLAASCSTNDHFQYNEEFILTGYSSVEARTSFDTPTESQIPFLWSEGDYIWLGSFKSKAIAEACESAQFKWDSEPSTAGDYHVFYNMTGEHKNAHILAEQTADGNLGNDGDFGYAVADEYKTFCLEHKTAYLWFDTTSEDVEQTLVSITVTAAKDIALAGECTFNYESNEWMEDITNASNEIVLNFGEGVALKEENEGIFAAMVTLPAEIGGTELTVVYTFADGSTFTEVKSPSKDLTAGAARRIATAIAAEALVAPIKVLTFEDEDARFSRYTLDYCSVDVDTWSDLIADSQLPGSTELLYGPGYSYTGADYYWSDAGNTLLTHAFGEGSWGKAFSSGGMALSNYMYTDDIEELDASLYAANSAYSHQLSVCSTTSPNNFVVAYCDSTVDGQFKNEISFSDEQARVIESIDVCIPVVTLYCIKYGSEFNQSFDGDDFLKLVATGYKKDGTTDTAEIILASGNDYSQWKTEWTEWDLSSLGAVKKVAFHMEEAQKTTYDEVTYYYCSPLFFACDNIVVRF